MARGSISTRTAKSGAVTHYIHYRTADGTQVKKAVGPSLRAAERALTAALAAVDRGELRTVTRETFAEYAERWLAEHRPRVEAGTFADYRKSVEKYLIPALGARKLAAISRAHVRQLVADLVAEGRLANKTVNNAIVPLRLMLAHAVDDGLIPSSPAASTTGSKHRVRLPAAHREMEYLRVEEIARYLGARPAPYQLLAEVLIGAGLRISEALALEWTDVDLENGAIVVQRPLKANGQVGSTKSDRARRVEIGPRLVRLLADRRALAGEHHEGPSPPVFPAAGGGHLNRTYVSNRWHQKALARAGLRRLRLHDLRGTAAASWLAAGLPLVYVQRQLGHAAIATTMRHYGHLERGYMRDGAAVAEALVWPETVTTALPRG